MKIQNVSSVYIFVQRDSVNPSTSRICSAGSPSRISPRITELYVCTLRPQSSDRMCVIHGKPGHYTYSSLYLYTCSYYYYYYYGYGNFRQKFIIISGRFNLRVLLPDAQVMFFRLRGFTGNYSDRNHGRMVPWTISQTRQISYTNRLF